MSRKFNAILGLGALAAFGFASSAFAQCPTGPVPPWTGQTQTQGVVAIATPGMDATTCLMRSSLNPAAGSFAAATVRDETPSDEPRYRAQFFIDADAVTNQTSFEGTYILSVQSAAAYLGSPFIVRMSMTGGANRNLNVFTADEGAPGNLSQVTIPLAAGENTVEIDWQVGSGDGSLAIWVNNSDSGTPTATISDLNNAGWVGVDAANLGLAAANNVFRTNHGNQPVDFDEFDSRRQTFIGE